MPTVTADIDLADYLRGWRRRLGLSQKQAAETLGLSRRTYQQWEAGKGCLYPRLVVLACERVEGRERQGN